MATRLPWRQPPLTPEQENTLFMITVADDTEDAPWMVMGDAQFWAASSLAHSLYIYAKEQGLGWYVASMLPINYRWAGLPRIHTVAPDVFVAFVPDHRRQSYDLAAEGSFPPFVLEVVSPSSVARDLDDKLEMYDLLGAREYALLRTDKDNTPLQGYRRGASDHLEPWLPDAEGRLWSEVLGLYLLVRDGLVQAMTRDGGLLLTPEQEAAARQQEAAARKEAEAARQQAEDEAARLRAELDRLRGRESH